VFALLIVPFNLSTNLATPTITHAADPLPKPENIRCNGYDVDDVRVGWDDTATDEDEYRMELKIGSGDWSEVATLTVNAEGRYELYKDTDVSGDLHDRRYRLRSYRSSDDSYSPYSDVCNGRRIYETDNFRIFYGIKGIDDCPLKDGREVCLTDDTNTNGENIYILRVAEALQGSVDAFARLGFTRSAGEHHSLDKIPINVTWCDSGGCASGSDRLGLSPFLVEKSFDLNTRAGDPAAWVVSLHEMFHFQQFRYWGLDDPASRWVTEGQARSIQDKVCMGPSRSDCVDLDDIDVGFADYVGEVNEYLGNPPQNSINRRSYEAVLFWTYLTEKYGTAPTDDVEGGMNLMVKFWEDSANTPGRDGITVLNSTLDDLGHSERFRDIWKDFAVANYAKDYNGPAIYQYADMQQPGGTYDPVRLDVSTSLATGDQVLRTGEFLPPWAPRYYEVRPSSNLPIIDVQVTQDSATPVYYTLLAIKGNDIVYEENSEARDFASTLINNDYDKVVLIVASLENIANYRVSINGNQPELRIVSPTNRAPVQVGDPAAPDKFRVALQVLSPSGELLEGVDLNNFSFRVGTQEVPAGNLITSAQVMDQYWFVLRAPTQASGGSYNLEASYGSALTDTNTNAVSYVPRTNADNIITIDRSGSMSNDGKLEAAQAAAKLYVDSWQNGDQVGVVPFNSSAIVALALSPWSTSRDQAINEIDSLTATGGTAIGDALRDSWDELKNDGATSSDWAIVLLSDGEETTGIEDFQDVVNDIRSARNDGDKVPVIHSVAVGSDADQAGMQRAARRTGGNYHYVSVPINITANDTPQVASDTGNLSLDLASAYRMVATTVVGQQQVFETANTQVLTSPEDTISIPVESGASELVVTLHWTDSALYNMTLENPSDATVPLHEQEGDATASGHAVWRVSNPQGGTWTLKIDGFAGGDVIFPIPPYIVQASLRSEVTMETYISTPTDQPVAGLPITFLVSLTDNGPITGASVEATIDPQSVFGSQSNLTLLDDGQHNDGAANDGIYAATLYETDVLAPHLVSVVADGTSSISGNFHREQTFAFYPTHEDSDNNGLPDAWEEYYGTDANEDPDGDGLPNENEQEEGTHPFNPDTDNDNVTDGSDSAPLDPSNGTILPTWSVAHAGIGEIALHYAVPQEYARIDIYRGGSLNGPFTYLDGGFGDFITGEYLDTSVSNGTTYCYYLVARAFNFQETKTAPTCATPSPDPYPPHGLVDVVDDDGVVPTTQVTLSLWASDSIDPEFSEPDEALPPDDSATGVADMMISNRADMQGASWEPYTTTRLWTLANAAGLNHVFVKYRDNQGNESEVYTASVQVDSNAASGQTVFLPLINK
jgi:Mg-chelatase subunit ChlD